jgi:hypothetical protein
MNDRFISLTLCFNEDEALFSTPLRINPFQIESYVPAQIFYVDEEGIPGEHEGTKIYSRGGFEYEIMETPAQLEALLG